MRPQDDKPYVISELYLQIHYKTTHNCAGETNLFWFGIIVRDPRKKFSLMLQSRQLFSESCINIMK